MKFVYIIVTSLLLVSCAALETARNAAEVDLPRDVATATLDYNDAYNKAVNSQILLNVLRARERLPRQYTILGELSLNPSSNRSFKVSPSGVKLGNNGIDPWLTLGGEYAGNRTEDLTFKVTPAVSSEVQTFYNPISSKLFYRYVSSDWSEEMLSELLIGGFYKLGGDLGQIETPCPSDTPINSQRASYLDCIIVRGLHHTGALTIYVSPDATLFCFSLKKCLEEPATAVDDKDGDDASDKGGTAKTTTFDNQSDFVYISNVNLSAAPDSTDIQTQNTLSARLPMDALMNDQPTVEGDELAGFLFCAEDPDQLSVSKPKGNKTRFNASYPSKRNYVVLQCQREPVSPTPICMKKNEKGECTARQPAQTSIFYIERRHPNADDLGWNNPGIYSVQLNSIDDIIYYLGASIRQAPGTDAAYQVAPLGVFERIESRSKIQFSASSPAPVTLFSAFQSGGESQNAERCHVDNFIAAANFQGSVYLAGSPQTWTIDDAESNCRLKDRSGTVFTLVSQIIELSQKPEEIETTSLFLRGR